MYPTSAPLFNTSIQANAFTIFIIVFMIIILILISSIPIVTDELK